MNSPPIKGQNTHLTNPKLPIAKEMTLSSANTQISCIAVKLSSKFSAVTTTLQISAPNFN